MRRLYVDTAHFRAPYDSPTLTLTGLGDPLIREWPRGRSYVDVSHFRAPYDQGYFQDNTLFGIGQEPTHAPDREDPTLLGSTAVLVGVGAAFGLALGFVLYQAARRA